MTIPEGIGDIFLMNKLERKYHINAGKNITSIYNANGEVGSEVPQG